MRCNNNFQFDFTYIKKQSGRAPAVPFGASNGQETDTVEIYYQEERGSHMRPKDL
jgi:hypothetical protein